LEIRWKNITQDIKKKDVKDQSELLKESFTRLINNVYQSEIYLNEKHKLLPFLDEVLTEHSKDLLFTPQLFEELKQRLEALNYDKNLIKKMQIFSNIYSGNQVSENLPLQDYLKQDECRLLEFKSSMLWDKGKNQKSANNYLALVIIKSIASFLNSEGGILLVGIDPKKAIIGIENDFKCLGKDKNFDGWQQYLSTVITNHLKQSVFDSFSVHPIHQNGKTIAKIIIKKHYEPVYVRYKDDKGQERVEFYIRGLNTRRSLDPEAIPQYIDKHWNN
jgi:hypothetical protein